METPRPCRDTVATGPLRGPQAWPEQGAGAQGTPGELEAVPVPEGQPCSLARKWCPARGLQRLRGHLGLRGLHLGLRGQSQQPPLVTSAAAHYTTPAAGPQLAAQSSLWQQV